MKTVLGFISDNWPVISGVGYFILARIIPTERSIDILNGIKNVMDCIIPNIKKGGGRHKGRK